MNTKALESLIVVTVHVAHQKVKDGKIDQVQQTAALVIKRIIDVKVQEFVFTRMLMIMVIKDRPRMMTLKRYELLRYLTNFNKISRIVKNSV